MSHKQIFLTFEGELLDAVKERCALTEKRSVTSLLRKLFADLPLRPDVLGELGRRLNPEGRGEAALTRPANIAVRFPEDEYWEAKAKAALARMTVKEFSTELLKLWVKGELEEWLAQLSAQQQAGIRHAG
jgi:hypothetical protein